MQGGAFVHEAADPLVRSQITSVATRKKSTSSGLPHQVATRCGSSLGTSHEQLGHVPCRSHRLEPPPNPRRQPCRMERPSFARCPREGSVEKKQGVWRRSV